MKVTVRINAYHLIVEQQAAEGGAFPLGETHPVAHCSGANGGILYNVNSQNILDF